MDKTLTLKAVVSNEADKTTGQATVYMVESASQTILPITVDLASAEAIIVAQQNLLLPRPHTHDLVKRLLNCFGARITDVVIYGLEEDIFYAYIRLFYNDEFLEFDAKASDAVAMAIRCQVPIFVKEVVLEKGGIKIAEELLY